MTSKNNVPSYPRLVDAMEQYYRPVDDPAVFWERALDLAEPAQPELQIAPTRPTPRASRPPLWMPLLRLPWKVYRRASRSVRSPGIDGASGSWSKLGFGSGGGTVPWRVLLALRCSEAGSQLCVLCYGPLRVFGFGLERSRGFIARACIECRVAQIEHTTPTGVQTWLRESLSAELLSAAVEPTVRSRLQERTFEHHSGRRREHPTAAVSGVRVTRCALWRRRRPKAPGVYVVASADGSRRAEVELRHSDAHDLEIVGPAPKWPIAWWWACPLPRTSSPGGPQGA